MLLDAKRNALGLEFQRGEGGVSAGASEISSILGVAGFLSNPTDPIGDLLEGVGLLEDTSVFQKSLTPTQQISLDAASTAVSCGESLITSGVDVLADAGCGLSVGSDMISVLSVVASAVQQDPPDQGYHNVFVPQPIVSVPIPLAGISGNLGTAIWTSLNAVDQTTMWLNALRVTANRYGTALAAGDRTSAGLQYMAFLNYLGLYLQAAANSNGNLTALANLLQSAGLGMQPPSSSQITQGLNYLAAKGTSSTFLNQFFTSLGFTPAQIQSMIQQALANPPSPTTVSPVQALQGLSNALVNPGVHLGAISPLLTLDSSTGQYVATVNMVNTGSVAIDIAQINASTTTLGTAPTISSPSLITNLTPWAGAVITLRFPATALPKGTTSAPLKITGTYKAGTLTGNWSLTFRSVTLH
jgi:hypothetical protein